MVDRCFEPAEYEDLVDLEPGDPRCEHLARCPICRARLAAFRAFLEKRPAAGSRPGEAEAALEKFVRETAGQGGNERSAVSGRRLLRLPVFSLRRVAATALAGAAIVALVLIWWPARHQSGEPSGLLRRETQSATATPTLISTSIRRPDGGIVLRWQRFSDANEYRVQLFNTRLEEIARFSAGPETTLVLMPEQLAAPSGQLLWRVQALQEGTEVAHSQPAALR